ncbi:MAG: 30S ribosomal protein S5 [Deinococcus sp.]|nr:30S ribosomal protein S5 [Deinococcus sp.]
MADTETFEDKVIELKRTAKTYKGGKRFRFSALVVVGDRQGRVGLGLGKAKEVPLAVAKGTNIAKKNLKKIPLINGTIPHEIIGRHGASQVLLKPAMSGTGVIAGSAVRAIAELAGITDILTKVLGSPNTANVAYATIEGLLALDTKESVKELRGE